MKKEEAAEQTSSEKMWVEIDAFIRSLNAVPGWAEFQRLRFQSVVDADFKVVDSKSEINEFSFPQDVEERHSLVMAYLELKDSTESVKSCEYYFRRYPFNGLPISRHEHLSNICEMYFGRFYQFKERLKIYSTALIALSPGSKSAVQALIKKFSSEFNQEIRARNEIHHYRRFSDSNISRVYISGVLALTHKGWEEELAIAYRKTAQEWAARVKRRGLYLDVFMEAVASFTLNAKVLN